MLKCPKQRRIVSPPSGRHVSKYRRIMRSQSAYEADVAHAVLFRVLLRIFLRDSIADKARRCGLLLPMFRGLCVRLLLKTAKLKNYKNGWTARVVVRRDGSSGLKELCIRRRPGSSPVNGTILEGVAYWMCRTFPSEHFPLGHFPSRLRTLWTPPVFGHCGHPPRLCSNE